MLKLIKPYTILLILVLSENLAFGQSSVERIDSLTENLSWQSISMDCVATMLVLTHKDSTEKELVKIGKPATSKLIKALSNTNKTVIAHIILTQIWSDKKVKDHFMEKYIYKDCNQLIGTHFLYNGLVWEWYSDKGDSIKQSEVEKIKKYWTEKIIAKKNVSLNLAQISRDLDKEDNYVYPCNKIYKNNSAAIKYQDLQELLGKKSDNFLFKNLWNMFGNDSIVDKFDDCFYVTYGPEGLSFRFEKDSTLSTIFVKDSYRGELPYKLKLTDRKTVVEKGIGYPFKSGKYGDNSWGWYKDKFLYLDFDKKGRIIKFGISKT